MAPFIPPEIEIQASTVGKDNITPAIANKIRVNTSAWHISNIFDFVESVREDGCRCVDDLGAHD